MPGFSFDHVVGMPGPRVLFGVLEMFLGLWGAMRGGIFGPMPGFSPCPSGVWDAGAQGPEVPLDTPIPFDAMDQIW